MLNKNIKKLRLARGISQVELAAALGVTKQSVSNWENDNILPSIDMLMKLSKYFSVSTDYLLGLVTEKSLDVSNIDDNTVSHLRLLIEDIQNQKKYDEKNL